MLDGARATMRTLAEVRMLALMLDGKKSQKKSIFIKNQTLPKFSDLSSNLSNSSQVI
jgi:hypothetical protein